MKRWLVLALVVLLCSLCRAEVKVFLYGNESFCLKAEKNLAEIGLRTFCFVGNPFERDETVALMAKLKADIVFFPKPLLPLFGPRAFTGSLVEIREIGDGLYAGVWPGGSVAEARRVFPAVVERIRPLLELFPFGRTRIGGWWLLQLSRTDLRSKTKIPTPFDYAEAEIVRFPVPSFPQKAFVVRFKKPLSALSSLEGFGRIRAVSNVYIPPSFWKKSSSLGKLIKKASTGLGLQPEKSFMLFTGADVDNTGFSEKRFGDLVVWAAVTAGVLGNAVRSGLDTGSWLETEKGWRHVGTINIVLFINHRLSQGAMVQAVMRAAEAKAAVLEELRVKSSYSFWATATSTGTDNIVVVAGPKRPELRFCGGHTKLGELVAKAVREALFKAVYFQNGLSPQ